jgi:hypothetical protein
VKIYSYDSDRAPFGGTLTVEGSQTQRLPLVINSEVRFARMTAVFTMLLDYLGDEADSEVKARVLSAAINRYIIRRMGPMNPYGWRISESELTDAISTVLVEGYAVNAEAEHVTLEYISGQRRDTLRLQ